MHSKETFFYSLTGQRTQFPLGLFWNYNHTQIGKLHLETWHINSVSITEYFRNTVKFEIRLTKFNRIVCCKCMKITIKLMHWTVFHCCAYMHKMPHVCSNLCVQFVWNQTVLQKLLQYDLLAIWFQYLYCKWKYLIVAQSIYSCNCLFYKICLGPFSGRVVA